MAKAKKSVAKPAGRLSRLRSATTRGVRATREALAAEKAARKAAQVASTAAKAAKTAEEVGVLVKTGKFLVERGLPAFLVYDILSATLSATTGRRKRDKQQALEDALLGGPTPETLADIEQEDLNDLLRSSLDVQTGLEGVSGSFDLLADAGARSNMVRNQLNQISDIAQRSEPSVAEQVARVRALLA